MSKSPDIERQVSANVEFSLDTGELGRLLHVLRDYPWLAVSTIESIYQPPSLEEASTSFTTQDLDQILDLYTLELYTKWQSQNESNQSDSDPIDIRKELSRRLAFQYNIYRSLSSHGYFDHKTHIFTSGFVTSVLESATLKEFKARLLSIQPEHMRSSDWTSGYSWINYNEKVIQAAIKDLQDRSLPLTFPHLRQVLASYVSRPGDVDSILDRLTKLGLYTKDKSVKTLHPLFVDWLANKQDNAAGFWSRLQQEEGFAPSPELALYGMSEEGFAFLKAAFENIWTS